MEFQALSKYEVIETKYELRQTDLMMMTNLIEYHDDDAPDLPDDDAPDSFLPNRQKTDNTSQAKSWVPVLPS